MTNLIQIQRSYDYVQQMIDEEHTRLSETISTFAELA
jgi:flagellar basal body rod protein FlgG